MQKNRIKQENIRRDTEQKQRDTHLTEQSQYNFSMFGTGSFMERIGVTEEKMYCPMALYSIFSGENFKHLTCFISKLKEWQDRQLDYPKISLKIEIEDKIIEQENKRREIEAQIKKINDLEIKELQSQKLTSKQRKELNNSNEFIKSFNVVNYDDINKWENKCKNKWLLEIKKNIDINRKKQLEQRKIADEMWKCQLREISGEFDNKLRCCNNCLQDTDKITLEGLAERLINSSFLDLEDHQHQEEVDLNNQTNQNTVWTKLREFRIALMREKWWDLWW